MPRSGSGRRWQSPTGAPRSQPPVYDHEFSSFTGLAGAVEVEPGSILWELVGEREAVEAPALFGQFDFTGTTAVVAPAS